MRFKPWCIRICVAGRPWDETKEKSTPKRWERLNETDAIFLIFISVMAPVIFGCHICLAGGHTRARHDVIDVNRPVSKRLHHPSDVDSRTARDPRRSMLLQQYGK